MAPVNELFSKNSVFAFGSLGTVARPMGGRTKISIWVKIFQLLTLCANSLWSRSASGGQEAGPSLPSSCPPDHHFWGQLGAVPKPGAPLHLV